jgi:arsenate reductase
VFPAIKKYCDGLKTAFGTIPGERKKMLEEMAVYISERTSKGRVVNLVYICTHNSRRSHFGQVWAKVAAAYYNLPNVSSYSGGTEATAFHKNAINALVRTGLRIEAVSFDNNPIYLVHYDDSADPIECYSKLFDDKKNPAKDFAAIMTCGEADFNCPIIPGADLRISTSYEDPKAFDSTPDQDGKYDERCKQIATETLYAFSKVER